MNFEKIVISCSTDMSRDIVARDCKCSSLIPFIAFVLYFEHL